MEEPIRGKAEVHSLLSNFLVPLHAMAEVGGVSISIRETLIHWRCYRRDPFCLDTGVGRGDRQNLHCELARLTEMERLACSAGASL